jgi:hypothetical protein
VSDASALLLTRIRLRFGWIEADRLRSREVDEQIELGRRFDRQIAELRIFENPAWDGILIQAPNEAQRVRRGVLCSTFAPEGRFPQTL